MTKLFFATITLFISVACQLLAYTPPSPQELQLKADAGDADAQAMLGESYARGEWGVEKDYEQALKYLRPAAEQNNPVALNCLGFMYSEGYGVDQDLVIAGKYFMSSFRGLNDRKDTADPRLLQNLSTLYLYGYGTKMNLKTSLDLSLMSAEQGYARAQSVVGVAYMRGKGLSKDGAAAVKWFRLAAEQGYAPAQYSMGILYKHGDGYVDQNRDEAIKWFTLAADQGFAPAAKALQEMPSQEQLPADEIRRAKAEKLKGQTLVVKGLYIGMDISNVDVTVKASFPEEYGKQGPFNVTAGPGAYAYSDKGQYYYWIGGMLPAGLIFANEYKEVTFIQFSTALVNELFKAEEMEASGFVKTFAKGYKIPEFKPKDDRSGWYYTSPDGYKVTIDDKKEVTIEKTATAKEAQSTFD